MMHELKDDLLHITACGCDDSAPVVFDEQSNYVIVHLFIYPGSCFVLHLNGSYIAS